MYDYITLKCLSFWSAHLCCCCCLVTKSFLTPWTVAQEAPLSMGFPRKSYWSGLAFPSSRVFPVQGSNSALLQWQVDSLSLRQQKVQFSPSVVSDSVTPWIAACQASLSITNSQFTQTHAHRVGDAIQPSHPLSSPSSPAPNPSKHQGLFQWVNSPHEVAKILEFQL